MTDTLTAAEPAWLDIEICRDQRAGLETRAEGDGAMPTMYGHFSKFNVWYEINSWIEGRFLEQIAPGSFRKTIKENGDRIRVLLEHGYDPVVGDKPLGAPTDLREDGEGAYYEVPLFDTSYNRDLVPALEAGVYGASFRMQVIKDKWSKEPGKSAHNPDGLPERTITEVRVREFGPTIFPASPTATANARSDQGDDPDERHGSATDRYYEQLRDRSPEQYSDALRRVQELRTSGRAPDPEPVTPAATPGTGAAAPADPVVPEAAPPTPDEPRKHSEASSTPTNGRRKAMSHQLKPMSVEERRERIIEIKARLDEIDNEHYGAVMPDEPRTEFQNLKTEYAEHHLAILDVEQRRREIESLPNLDGVSEQSAPMPSWSKETMPSARGAARRGPSDIYDLGEYRKMARTIDDLGRMYRDGAMRAVEKATFPGQRRETAQDRVAELLDTVDDEGGTLARRILATGSQSYDRAFGKAVLARSTAGLTPEEQRALSVASDGAGGYAVPYQLDPTVILTSDGSSNPLRQISRVEPIVGKEWQGVTSAGVIVTRTPEVAEATDDGPTFTQPVVRPSAVHGFIPFSMDLDQDWPRLRGELAKLINAAKDDEEAASFVNGLGTLISGGGHNPDGIAAGLAAGSEVPDGGSFTSQLLYDMEAGPDGLPERFRSRARWLANKAIYNLARQFGSDNDGADLWVRLGQGLPSELIGYPAHEASAMPTTPAGRYLILGDFSQYLIVDRVGMDIELVPHIFGAARRMPTGQRGIYARWRNSSKILVDNAFRVAVDGS